MSGFIYRDYATPIVMSYTNKVALRNLYSKVVNTATLDGVPVYEPRIYFRGRQGTCNACYPSAGENRIRDDKTFKRFIKKLGISWKKDLVDQKYKNISNAYFYLNDKKVKYATQSTSDISDNLNAYLSKGIDSSSTTAIYHGYVEVPGDIIHTYAVLPGQTYSFYVNGVDSTTTADGYYSITPKGQVALTQAGYDAGRYKVSYDPAVSNTTSTTLKISTTAIVNNVETTTVEYRHISINVYRDFIDLQITVSGEYNTPISVNNVPLTVSRVNLPAIRAEIESNPVKWLANIDSNTVVISIEKPKIATLYAAGASMAYDEEDGNLLDLMAIMDDGSVFEPMVDVANEVLSIEEINATTGALKTAGSSVYTSRVYTVNYTYTKRYKIARMSNDTDTVVTAVSSASDMIVSSLDFTRTRLPRPFRMNTILRERTNAAVDSLLKEAIMALNDDGLDAAMFYRGCLRVDAFNEMTPNEFFELISTCFDFGYTKKKSKWYKKVLAIIIVIIAVVIAVVTFMITFDLQKSLLFAQLWLAFAGALYAKHVGDEWGMKFIGKAIQINGIALSIVTTANIVGNIQQAFANHADWQAALTNTATNELQKQLAAQAATQLTIELAINTAIQGVVLAGSLLSLGGQLGIIDMDSNFAQNLGTATSVLSLGTDIASGIHKMTLSDSIGGYLKDHVFADASGWMRTLNNGAAVYMNLTRENVDIPRMVDEDHATSQNSVEAVYLIQERQVATDALEKVDEMVRSSFGLNKTQMLISATYGV